MGSHLACYLVEKGYDVAGIRRKESDLSKFLMIKDCYQISDDVWNTHFNWKEADILDISSLDDATTGIDVVIHSAGLVSFLRKDQDKMLKINQEGTENVVNACLRSGVKKLVHVSSTSVFPSTDKVVDESMDFNPDGKFSYYGLTKHLAEMEVFRGQEEGLNVAIVNPSIILGFGDWNEGSSRLFKQSRKSFSFFSQGANAFVGVKDVCVVIEKLISRESSGRYLCVSENLSFRDVQNMMSDAFSSKRPTIRVGKGLTSLAWMIASLLRLFGIETMITRESARSANRIQRYDSSKVQTEFGVQFTPVETVIGEAVYCYKKKYG